MTCGSHQDVRYTTEELLDITAQYATEEDAVGVVYAPGDKEEVPGSNWVVPSNITIQGTKKGTKGGRKRCPRWFADAISYDDDKKADDSDKEYIMAAEQGFKRHARPPTYHFERLLESACLDHAYPIMHNLKECGMMKIFMSSGDLTRGS
jgi:hypothetical protein